MFDSEKIVAFAETIKLFVGDDHYFKNEIMNGLNFSGMDHGETLFEFFIKNFSKEFMKIFWIESENETFDDIYDKILKVYNIDTLV